MTDVTGILIGANVISDSSWDVPDYVTSIVIDEVYSSLCQPKLLSVTRKMIGGNLKGSTSDMELGMIGLDCS